MRLGDVIRLTQRPEFALRIQRRMGWGRDDLQKRQRVELALKNLRLPGRERARQSVEA